MAESSNRSGPEVEHATRSSAGAGPRLGEGTSILIEPHHAKVDGPGHGDAVLADAMAVGSGTLLVHPGVPACKPAAPDRVGRSPAPPPVTPPVRGASAPVGGRAPAAPAQELGSPAR